MEGGPSASGGCMTPSTPMGYYPFDIWGARLEDLRRSPPTAAARPPFDAPFRMVFEHGRGEGGGGRGSARGMQAGGAASASPASVRTRLRPSSVKVGGEASLIKTNTGSMLATHNSCAYFRGLLRMSEVPMHCTRRPIYDPAVVLGGSGAKQFCT
jgi:hypothetical protein